MKYVIGRCEYLTGCTQYLLVPRTLDKDGKRRDGEWFDEQRLKATNKRIEIDNGSTPGCDERSPSVTR